MTRRTLVLGPGILQRISFIFAFPAVAASSLHGRGRFAPIGRLRMEGEAPGGLGGLLKTGTTIAGVVCGDAVILAADTRSTMGHIVANKNCEKIHVISDSIYCCGAGTAADADRLTGAVRTWLRLEQLRSIMSIGDQDALPSPRVAAAAAGLSRLLSGGGNEDGEGRRRKPSAAFVLGGVDATGPHLYQIESCGTAQKVAFTALGSGSLAAISALEAQYRRNMTLEEGRALLVDAITAGILNDMGSGSNVDMCVIRKGAPVEYTRGYVGGYRRTDAGGEKGREQALRVLVGGREGRSKETESRACRSETLRLVQDDGWALGRGREGVSGGQRFAATVTDMPDDQVEFL